MGNNFIDVISNNLEEIHMFAGDVQKFEYTVFTEESIMDLSVATCSVLICAYGDPSEVIVTLEGIKSITESNKFTATLRSSQSINLSGVYLQIPRIYFGADEVYNPGRGKIIVFPSPAITV